MLDGFQEGDIIEGKITGIKPFGAFVTIDNEHQGLVHISEVAHDYVKDIHDYVTVGDQVRVKILKIDEDSGKISLSIRGTQDPPSTSDDKRKKSKNEKSDSLEDKLKNWLKESNEKQEQLNKRLKNK